MAAIPQQATRPIAGGYRIGLAENGETRGAQAVGQVLRTTDEHGELHGDNGLGGAGRVALWRDPLLHCAIRAQSILYL